MDQLLLDMKKHYPSMTTVVITHDLGSVRHIADHVLVIGDGRAAFSGSKEELTPAQTLISEVFSTAKLRKSAA